MADLPLAAAHKSPKLGLLMRMKTRSVYNRVVGALAHAPLRVAASIVFLLIIWGGLTILFLLIFRQLARTPLESTVAIPLVFSFFFLTILMMLTLSNAIIIYGTLFSRHEASYLLTLPLSPIDVVSIKYFESLLLSSWSLFLLGVPLMNAMMRDSAGSSFALLFVAFFAAFIPIPGALGLLLAWFGARFLTRRLVRALGIVSGILLAGLIVWGLRSVRVGSATIDEWLQSFLAQMSFVRSTFLPSNWVSAGIDNALHGNAPDAMMYLACTITTGAFLSWFAVRWTAGRLDIALDRASSAVASGAREAAEASGGVAGALFFYLPTPLKLVAAKDLRTFLRDPLQWSQLAILFGLLGLYLTNMPTLRTEFASSGWFLVIPLLNLCAVSLILATFTCRFVFPLVSLEGQKLWLMGVLPMPRGRILLSKFAFSMTVTLTVAVGAMYLATIMLELTPIWALIHLSVTVAVCFGLCGLAVGVGARVPMFHTLNAARIANGIGGTANLLASVALIGVMMLGVGYATWNSRSIPAGAIPRTEALAACGGAVLIGLATGVIALWIGAKHFNRVEV